jgi:hypothetical protein
LNKPQEKKVAECQDARAEQQLRADSKVSHALPSDRVSYRSLRERRLPAPAKRSIVQGFAERISGPQVP